MPKASTKAKKAGKQKRHKCNALLEGRHLKVHLMNRKVTLIRENSATFIDETHGRAQYNVAIFRAGNWTLKTVALSVCFQFQQTFAC